MARPTPLSGFPEWLPADRIVERHIIDTLASTFELHGYAEINTRAVETIEQLSRKGEIDKEVYAVNRLHAEPGEERNPLGLHFDLTVPFARYVVENAGKLVFPFKRYQIQPVWRGERPQDGRFREFIQADIDVVGDGELPAFFEVEVPLILAEVFGKLRDIGVPPMTIQVNNRKLLEGFSLGVGIDDVSGVLRALDKLDKIGPDAVGQLLADECGANDEQVRLCLALAQIEGDDASVVDDVRALGVTHPLLDEGLEALAGLMTAASERAPGAIRAQLKIARGLDYYTGTVYETVVSGHEDLGSVCSGGRYDNLASSGTKTYPGVGISLGVTRLMSRLVGRGLVSAGRRVPTVVLVTVADEDSRADADRIAGQLRARGISAEVSPNSSKFGKQIRYADRRGIPYVWFGSSDGDQVKDIRSGDQTDADANAWTPPSEDLRPAISAT
ncbi:histidine--tRNA ligase [Spelaeicoccus albus]|uniref:Histidine--tRNA ligase n=1 Tax=Spelaeicoccus albus TaxID=1280376 RepID=A0A7Z0IIN8_9MICO|nr:histidine--tRNA ligase [Spelaeicoccus albus]NYI68644.1 histidyl-tRNA synthetase [Spelaeicoccus albus]